MSDVIGGLDRETLSCDITLDSLEPLAKAYWRVSGYEVPPSQFTERFGSERGMVQVNFPGPVVEFEKLNGGYPTKIYTNGVNGNSTEKFVDLLMEYASMDKAP